VAICIFEKVMGAGSESLADERRTAGAGSVGAFRGLLEGGNVKVVQKLVTKRSPTHG